MANWCGKIGSKPFTSPSEAPTHIVMLLPAYTAPHSSSSILNSLASYRYLRTRSPHTKLGPTGNDKNTSLTEVGRGSIGIELVKSLLSRGAHVVITTSSYNRKTLEYYQSIFQTFGSPGSLYCSRVKGSSTAQSKPAKLGKADFYTRLLDLHRSNPFGITIPQYEEQQIPNAWLSRNEKYCYIRANILLGMGVIERYSDVHTVLQADPKTLMPGGVSGSPRMDYPHVPLGAKHMSRWKDWEELELLGKEAFGSVVEAKNKIDSRIYVVKKIRLKTMQSDIKIFQEVT
ncbi:hypothetical protein BD779DRAFT_1475139 [Infundibulicybe gibba]|nr:hypothetical protein BD779DRAFT_1475139 [Infundibulicybe gibba]